MDYLDVIPIIFGIGLCALIVIVLFSNSFLIERDNAFCKSEAISCGEFRCCLKDGILKPFSCQDKNCYWVSINE